MKIVTVNDLELWSLVASLVDIAVEFAEEFPEWEDDSEERYKELQEKYIKIYEQKIFNKLKEYNDE